MDMGIGFSEIILIGVLILVFFGPKELPRYIREAARFMAKVRQYSDKVRRELDTITETVAPVVTAAPPAAPSAQSTKQELRQRFLAARKNLTPEVRAIKSAAIRGHLMDHEHFRKAGAVMIYVNMGAEVETRETITRMLQMGKRVVVPYCKPTTSNLGLGEITDLGRDITIGTGNTPEPRPELHDRFYRSDLQLIICPCVGFDSQGNRLGRGKGYYDNFLRELKGSVPIIGLAFDCQRHDIRLPFSYSDVAMDQIITEIGPQIAVHESSLFSEQQAVTPSRGSEAG